MAVMRSLLLAFGFIFAGVSSAAAAPSPVMQFSLPASGGYTLHVKTEGNQTVVSASRGGSRLSSTYYVSESAGPGAIDADLGSLGSIDVHFEPSGADKRIELCHGGRHIVHRLGVFTGTISFRGESGYTAAEAAQAPGSVGPSARGLCRGRGKGPVATATTEARRQVERVWTVGDATLMNRNSTSPDADNLTLLLATAEGGIVRYLVDRIELPSPSLTIERQIDVVGPRSGFSYPHDYRTAVLQPPAPFSGKAVFSARRQRLRGDLKVAFPGLAPQSLTDGQFEARILPGR